MITRMSGYTLVLALRNAIYQVFGKHLHFVF
jgi:hypothetical protein